MSLSMVKRKERVTDTCMWEGYPRLLAFDRSAWHLASVFEMQSALCGNAVPFTESSRVPL